MILKQIKEKDNHFVIYIVGTNSDCNEATEMYHEFPNAKIYIINCCDVDQFKPYCDRITVLQNVSDYNGDIDVCYINCDNSSFTELLSLDRVKYVINRNHVLYDQTKKQVVLVSTGVFQSYLKVNVQQLLTLGYNVHVILDRGFFDRMSEFKDRIFLVDGLTFKTDFDSKSTLDKHFRDGFWNNASKRLFLLNEYITKNQMKHVIHIENDVMMYSDMSYDFGEDTMYFVIDAPHRCIPGIIYIPNHHLFNKVIDEYNYSTHDMDNLSNFYNNHKDIVRPFPIIDHSTEKSTYNQEFERFNSIFDGAAIGQYLGGVDPRNIQGDTIGFVNETCVIQFDRYKFKWLKKGAYFIPHVKINDRWILINNIHLHSKTLDLFTMVNPTENRCITKCHDES